MTVHREAIKIITAGSGDMTDISSKLDEIIKRANITTGTCHVFNMGSTGAIGTIELEPGLEQDFRNIMKKIIPPNKNYGHEQKWHDGNGHSHLQATIIGPEITVPVEKGHIVNGTWQQIFHYEADTKSRNRKIIVTVIGE
jgi:secondary thiamine-phosphate synthase enzyme